MDAWECRRTSLQQGRVEHLVLLSQGRRLTWANVAENWRANPDFVEWFVALLAGSPFPAFFWEHPPLVAAHWGRPYECVLVDSPQLVGVQAEPHSFSQHFRSGSDIVEFENLGGDAHLIAPAPAGIPGFGHIADFVRGAPAPLCRGLWRAIAEALVARAHDEPLWCSTSGLGVYWLHVRLDRTPKYYTYAPYRRLEP